MASRPFKELFAIPLRNGLTKPKAVRGAGTKMVNMGELFANPRIVNVAMDRVPLNQAERSSSLLAAGDLLFARQSLVLSGAGKCSIFVRDDENVCFESHVIRCRVSQELADPHFYYYFFSSPAGRALMESIVEQGAGASGIRGSDLAELSVPWIDPIFQRRVAGVLSQIDDKISFNRRIIQTLEAMAQAIFQSWFVEFDPVKAKIAAKQEGRDPLRAAMTAVSGKADAELDALPPEQYEQLAATAVLFPDEMEESELGEIPKGCIAGSLGDICNFTAGSAFSPEHQGSAGGDYPFIKVSDMNLVGNEVFIQSANNYVSQARKLEMKAKLHPQGATVFAKIGVALISNRRRLLITPTIIDNNMMSASPIEGKSASYFLYSMLSTIDFNTLVSGTALPYLNVSDLRKIPIVRPLDGVCRAFELKAASIFLMMQKLAAQSVTLASVRDALLPKLLSGEIEVSGLDEG